MTAVANLIAIELFHDVLQMFSFSKDSKADILIN